ncbi:MAG TPA: hypothetical protein VKZ49_18730 [Polyangiaceae bacterium]|nr:hypothetical protein [Polyangiaceae bacterium]
MSLKFVRCPDCSKVLVASKAAGAWQAWCPFCRKLLQGAEVEALFGSMTPGPLFEPSSAPRKRPKSY